MRGATRWLTPLLAAILMAAASSGCAGDGTSYNSMLGTPRSVPSESIVIAPGEPVVIGMSVALTGPSAPIGQEFRDAAIAGIELWKEANGPEIHGHEIVVHVEDDACTDVIAGEGAAYRLVAVKGLAGVLGPDCSVAAEAAIPVFSGAGIVSISGSSTRTDLTTIANTPPFFFRTAYRNDLQGTLIGLFASVGLQAGHVHLIDDGETYGIDLAEAAKPLMLGAGIEVQAESTPPGSEDFSEITRRIVAQDPDLVVFFGFNPQAALFYRQLRDAGYAGVFGAGDAAASQETFIGPLGSQAEGVLFAACAVGLKDRYLDAFLGVHGSPPDASAFAAQYIDAARILFDAIFAVSEEMSDGTLILEPLALRDAIASSDLEDGASGDMAFDKNGDRVPHKGDDLEQIIARAASLEELGVYVDFGLIPCQVQDGQFVPLLGPDAGQTRLP